VTPADRVTADLGAVKVGEVLGDVADPHAAGVQAEDPLVQPGQAGLALADQLGLERTRFSWIRGVRGLAREGVPLIVGGELPKHEFTLRPSTPEQERVLRALDGLDGFSSGLRPDDYFHVAVEAASFDEAQYRLRDTLAELEEPAAIPVLLEKRSETERD
jgi:hypothetical protein